MTNITAAAQTAVVAAKEGKTNSTTTSSSSSRNQNLPMIASPTLLPKGEIESKVLETTPNSHRKEKSMLSEKAIETEADRKKSNAVANAAVTAAAASALKKKKPKTAATVKAAAAVFPTSQPYASSLSSAASLTSNYVSSYASTNHSRLKREPFVAKVPTVGHHHESTNCSGSKYKRTASSSSSSTTNTPTTATTSIATATTASATQSTIALSSPLMSRYCGCCGDILSIQPYGFDPKGRCRNALCRQQLQQQQQQQQYETMILPKMDRDRILAAAKNVQQNLTRTKKSSKSTKASRKKKKLSASKNGNGTSSWHNHQNVELSKNHHLMEHLRGLSPWPQESVQMDMTILEGLLKLKHSPFEETNCSCWNNNNNKKKPATKTSRTTPITNGKSATATAKTSPKTKKLKATSKLAAAKNNKTKTKVPSAKKKSALTKGPKSLTSPMVTEIVTTKTIMKRNAWTGKMVKKTIRVVKKLVKKKLPLTNPMVPGTATGASPTSTTTNNNNKSPSSSSTTNGALKTPSALIPSFSSLGNANKETSGSATVTATATPASKGRKRSHSNNNNDFDDKDNEDASSSDESESGGSSSLKKRRRNDEKADLDLRERLMNCPLENGPLFPTQQELLELTTIRKRNALQTFYKRFNELRQFIAVFGDANVPQQFPENHSLGIWVNKMRMERKKWDTGSERTSLTERKIELLESIDFIWAQNHKGEIGWERRFQEIRKFKRKHGHCNVPTKSAENRALGRWVSTQRTMYKNYMKGFVGKSLTREEQERRIFLLLKEGFLFSMIPNGQSPNGGGEGQPASGDVEDMPKVDLAKAASASETLSTTEMEGGKTALGDALNQSTSGIDTTTTTSTTKSAVSPLTTTVASNSTPKAPNQTKDDTKTKSPIGGEVKPPVLSSPSKETLPKDERATATSSPPPAPASSVAQISVTTTPATTPSVSTTASPDRSPEKSIDDEPNSAKEKVKGILGKVKTMKDNPKENADELPVVPSLSKSRAKDDYETKSNLPMDGATKRGIQQAISLNSTEGTKPGASLEEISTKLSKAKGRLATKNDTKSTETEPTLPRNIGNNESVAKGKSISNSSPERKPPILSSNAENNGMMPEKPQLITSDGLRIIVKMTDSDNATSTGLSPRIRKVSTEGSPATAPSPSRRSVRARKPSARQLEAEKSPQLVHIR